LDIKLFKKTFKFICDDCGEFTHTETEYCEKCGANALRKATGDDYMKHEKIAVEYHKETKKKHDETKKEAKQEAKKAKKAKKK
jgi:hypothetical protein